MFVSQCQMGALQPLSRVYIEGQTRLKFDLVYTHVSMRLSPFFTFISSLLLASRLPFATSRPVLSMPGKQSTHSPLLEKTLTATRTGRSRCEGTLDIPIIEYWAHDLQRAANTWRLWSNSCWPILQLISSANVWMSPCKTLRVALLID